MIFIDIEVEVTDGFNDVSKKEILLHITMWDKVSDTYYTYVKILKKQIKNYTKNNIVVELFSTEYEMLNKFYQKYGNKTYNY